MLIDELVNVPESDKWGGIDKHHIVFRSQGGLDHGLNVIEMYHAFHIGPHGPHHDQKVREKLLKYQQERLTELFGFNEYYSVKVISDILDLNKTDKRKLGYRLFMNGRVNETVLYEEKTESYRGDLVVRTLMGGRLY